MCGWVGGCDWKTDPWSSLCAGVYEGRGGEGRRGVHVQASLTLSQHPVVVIAGHTVQHRVYVEGFKSYPVQHVAINTFVLSVHIHELPRI